jgi:hypothetical protein
MSKFTLKCVNEGVVNTLEFDGEYLPDILNHIEIFLMGCGFSIEYDSLQIGEPAIYVTPYNDGIGDTV